MNKNKWIYFRWFLLRVLLAVYDILSIYASAILALLVRFYVAKEFHPSGLKYFEAYTCYAPYYALLCIVIYALFRLYGSRWKYAGMNDLNRILLACATAFVCHVAGTLLFVQRMPISFYCITGFTQFCLAALIRFLPRLLIVEKGKLFKDGKAAEIKAMIVGTGDTGMMMIRQLERGDAVQPVCVLDYRNRGYGSLINGLPVIEGAENLKTAIDKYGVNLVIIASATMPKEQRDDIKKLCAEKDTEVQDYSAFLSNSGGHLTLRTLAECCSGSVEIKTGGETKQYADCEQALMNETGNRTVTGLSAKNNALVIELSGASTVLNDLNAAWVAEQQKMTGEEISFF